MMSKECEKKGVSCTNMGTVVGQVMICVKIALSYEAALPVMQATVEGFSHWNDFKMVL